MKKIRFVLTAMLLMFSVSAFAQGIKVTGTVSDASNGEPIIGASVLLQGSTTVYAMTDELGNFSITVPSDGVLDVNFLGFVSQEIPVDGKSHIDIALKPDQQLLDEVVVTAMGISREKKALGYAVQDVKGDVLVKAASSDLGSALQGKVAGLEISQSSGMPGASSKITIRGSRSFDGNNTPLYVVDGMPVASTPDASTGNSVTGSDYATRSLDIDPNDIESINVLKGQAASALYGMRASNGVIIITTKKGSSARKGRAEVSFKTNFSADVISTYPKLQKEYAQGSNGKYSPTSSLSWGPKISELANDPTYGGNTDNAYTQEFGKHQGQYYVKQRATAGLDPWATPQAYDNTRDFFQTGTSFGNSLSVAKNGDIGSIIFALGSTNTKGIVPNTGLNRYNARMAADTQLSKHFSMGFSGNFVTSDLKKSTGANNGITATIYNACPSYDLAGIPYHAAGDPYTQVNYRGGSFDNPYWATENNSHKEKSQRFFGNAYGKYNTDFGTSGKHTLDVKYQVGIDSYSTNYANTWGYGHSNGKGEIDEWNYNTNELNSLATVVYNWKINENWNFNALLGNEIVYNTNKTVETYGSNFNFSGWNNVNNLSQYQGYASRGQYYSLGNFINLSADYKGMLFLNVTGRQDMVSSMPRNNRTFFYPSVSAGFIFTELEALKNDVLTFGKIRASYAEVGEAGHYYQSYYSVPGYGGGFSSGTPVAYPLNGVVAYTPSSTIYDPNLKPQNTKSWEAGLDLGFFEGRITATYTFSRQNVVDQIFSVPMSSSTGYGSLVTNGGKMHTNAHELTMNFIPVQKKNFEWNIGFNFTKIDNYVDELAEGVESIFLGGFVTPQVRAGIGDKYPVLYGSSFLRNDKGEIVVDEDGYPQIGESKVIGTVSPDFQLGMNMGFRIYKLNISALFDWKQGGQMYCGSPYMADYYGVSQKSADFRSGDGFIFEWPAVKQDGTKNDIVIPASQAQNYFSALNDIDEAGIYDTSFIKLRELSISYPIVSKENFKLDINLFARNILIWTTLEGGFDPEVSQGNTNMSGGFERFSLPGTSSYGGGLSFKF